MPFRLNVGASRKVTDNNFGSRGASINLEMEVDTSLFGEPAKLQERIRQVFGVVRVSLDEELNRRSPPDPRDGRIRISPALQSNASDVNGIGNELVNGDELGQIGIPSQANPRRATPAQVRAISAIASRRQLNLAAILQNRTGQSEPSELTVRQASQMIDELKSTGVPSARFSS